MAGHLVVSNKSDLGQSSRPVSPKGSFFRTTAQRHFVCNPPDSSQKELRTIRGNRRTVARPNMVWYTIGSPTEVKETRMRRVGLWLLVVSLPLAAAGNTYGKLPLSFEPNQGQTDARVKFLARASGYTLFVTADEAVFAGRDGSAERMKLLGANPKLR